MGLKGHFLDSSDPKRPRLTLGRWGFSYKSSWHSNRILGECDRKGGLQTVRIVNVSHLVLAVILSLGPSIVQANSPEPELVVLFCEAQLSAEHQGRPLVENDQDWQVVAKTLLHRTRPITIAERQLQSTNKLSECVSHYRADFEEGEFIVKGLSLVDQTSQQQEHAEVRAADAQAQATLNRESKFPVEFLADPDSGQDTLAGLVPTPAPAELSMSESERRSARQALEQRRDNYLRLWNDFTRKLRDKITLTTVARGAAPSPRPE